MNIYSEDKMYESYSSEVEKMQKCIDELQQENKQIKIQISAREEVCYRLEEENKKYKEVIDKVRKEINEEHSIMGVEVVENWFLKDILKEVE